MLVALLTFSISGTKLQETDYVSLDNISQIQNDIKLTFDQNKGKYNLGDCKKVDFAMWCIKLPNIKRAWLTIESIFARDLAIALDIYRLYFIYAKELLS